MLWMTQINTIIHKLFRQFASSAHMVIHRFWFTTPKFMRTLTLHKKSCKVNYCCFRTNNNSPVVTTFILPREDNRDLIRLTKAQVFTCIVWHTSRFHTFFLMPKRISNTYFHKIIRFKKKALSLSEVDRLSFD